MTFLLIFILELLVLFNLSKILQSRLIKYLFLLTKRESWTMYLFAILFLPGTFIHEISHFLSALFLLVPVGDLEVIPKIEKDGIKLGGVSIGKTDPIRRFLIGLSPFFFGIGIILGLLFYVTQTGLLSNVWILLIVVYLMFQVGNSMYASKSDLKGAVFTLIFIIVAYILMIKLNIFYINSNSIFTPNLINIMQKACLFMSVPIIIDFMIIFFMKYSD